MADTVVRRREKPSRRRSNPKPLHCRRYRPRFETLEDRVTPSVTSVFELDGNAITTTTHDWDQVYADHLTDPVGTTSGAIASAFVTDLSNSRADDIFQGGGSKDVLGIQQGPWLFTDSKPQAKDDITHAYAALYTDPSNGHQILYAGLDRFDNSGDATAGFWFFRNNITESPQVSGNGTGPFLGTHADGDILLVSDFTTGGSVSTIKVFRWTGNDSTGSLVALNNGNPINGNTFAIVNSGSISTPWAYTNKSGQNQPAAGEFLEEGVDLSALHLSGCFASFMAETRSSQSPTATLSDFVLGSFPVCSLAAPGFTGLSKVGDSVTYPLTVQNTGAMSLYLQNVSDTFLGNIVVNGVVQSVPGETIDASAALANNPLPSGASVTIFVTRIVQPTDPDPTTSTVTFTYNDSPTFSDTPISVSATNSVNLFQPSATMTVTASPTTATSLGQPITYTYTVTNTSSPDSPNLVLSTSNPNNSFTDTLLGNLEADAIAAGGGSLAPKASFTFTETRAIQAGDPTPLTNTATVVFTLAQNLGSFSNQITGQASASVTLLPHLQIAKAVTPGFTDVIHPGDTASFTITVTNDGAGPATNVVVTDQLPAADELTWTVASSTFDTASISTGDFLTASSATLPAGASVSITVSAVIPLDIFGTTGGGTGSGDPVAADVFELDGNATTGVLGSSGSTTPSHDWDQVFNDVVNGTSTSGAIAANFVTDAVNTNGDDIFTGGGSKDTLGIQQGQWLFTDSKPQGKNDITHAYAATYTDPSNGHVLLFAGLDRFDNSGDATAGFWFFQNPIGQNPKVTTNGGHPFTGTHADGDILLVSDFTQGGSTSTIKVFRWTGDDATGSLVPVAAPGTTTFAIVNSGSIAVPWSFTDKSHHTSPAAGEFLEEGVDLTALGLGGCFSNFLAETRSSQSPTATLSDFVIGNFNTCRLDLPNTATVEADGIDPITSNQVLITVLDGHHALEATSVGSGAVTDRLTAEQLQLIVAQAINAWRAAGIDPQTLSNLDHVAVHLGNLPRAELGFASPGEIWIDQTAAGWGWSTNGDLERMDLPTVVTHELGHVLGFEHSDEGVMEAALAPGVRLVPEALTSTGHGEVPVASAGSTVSVVPSVSPLRELGAARPGAALASLSGLAPATGKGGDVAVLAAVGAFLDGTSTRGSLAGVLRNLGQQTAPVPAVVSAGAAGDSADVRTLRTCMESGGGGAAVAGDEKPDEVPAAGQPPTANPVDQPVDPQAKEQGDALLWREACDACFADESWMANTAEHAGQVLTRAEPSGLALAPAVVALGVLGGHWAVPRAESASRKRRRFLI